MGPTFVTPSNDGVFMSESRTTIYNKLICYPCKQIIDECLDSCSVIGTKPNYYYK